MRSAISNPIVLSILLSSSAALAQSKPAPQTPEPGAATHEHAEQSPTAVPVQPSGATAAPTTDAAPSTPAAATPAEPQGKSSATHQSLSKLSKPNVVRPSAQHDTHVMKHAPAPKAATPAPAAASDAQAKAAPNTTSAPAPAPASAAQAPAAKPTLAAPVTAKPMTTAPSVYRDPAAKPATTSVKPETSAVQKPTTAAPMMGGKAVQPVSPDASKVAPELEKHETLPSTR